MVETITKPDGSLTYGHLNVVEVIGFSLSGVPITPGQPFSADDDWLTNLRVKVKNVSDQSISHLRMNFALPEAVFIQDGRRYSLGFSVDYKAGARINDASPEMKVILPGDEVDLVCLIPLRDQLANKTATTNMTLLQYGGEVTAYFVDGSTWRVAICRWASKRNLNGFRELRFLTPTLRLRFDCRFSFQLTPTNHRAPNGCLH